MKGDRSTFIQSRVEIVHKSKFLFFIFYLKLAGTCVQCLKITKIVSHGFSNTVICRGRDQMLLGKKRPLFQVVASAAPDDAVVQESAESLAFEMHPVYTVAWYAVTLRSSAKVANVAKVIFPWLLWCEWAWYILTTLILRKCIMSGVCKSKWCFCALLSCLFV